MQAPRNITSSTCTPTNGCIAPIATTPHIWTAKASGRAAVIPMKSPITAAATATGRRAIRYSIAIFTPILPRACGSYGGFMMCWKPAPSWPRTAGRRKVPGHCRIMKSRREHRYRRWCRCRPWRWRRCPAPRWRLNTKQVRRPARSNCPRWQRATPAIRFSFPALPDTVRRIRRWILLSMADCPGT